MIEKHSPNHKRILFFFVFLALLTYFFLNKKNDLISPTDRDVAKIALTEETQSTIKHHTNVKVDISKGSPTPSIPKTQDDRAEVTRWFNSRGYFEIYGPEDQSDYKNYDIKTLEKLANDGDIHAMHELALKQERLENRKSVFYGAAVHGSTAALMDIGTSVWIEGNLDGKSEEQRKKVVLEALSFYQAAHLRGDSWAALNAGSTLLNLYPTTLTQADIEHIHRRGKEVYTELQDTRNRLNMGEFDNSIPVAAKKFIEDYRQQTNADTQNEYFKSIFIK